jgi:hypothetical protein
MANTTVRDVSVYELVLLAVTRALAGGGIALLVADRIEPRVRKRVAWTLLGVGLASTVPLARDLLSKRVRRIAPDKPRFAAPGFVPGASI